MQVFIGYDQRQPVAFQVLAHSIWKRASKPVTITRLDIRQLPIERQGLTEFTYSRYLVPWLCGFHGKALFLDADMLCLADVAELFDMEVNSPVSVVKSENRFEWPSMMLFNNPLCRYAFGHGLNTPDFSFIEEGKPQNFEWAGGADNVGKLPPEWNHIVPYDGENPDAKIIHYTQGIPCFPETEGCEWGEAWRQEAQDAMSTVSWEAIMGKSVHKQAMGL